MAQKVSNNLNRDSISTVIRKSIANSRLKDSTATYAFAFKLDVRKKGSRAEVTDINANDSIAYKLIPNYRFLSRIDYSKIGGSKDNFSLVIPFLISVYGSKDVNYGKIQYMESVTDAVDKLFFTTSDIRIGGGSGKNYPRSEEFVYLFPFKMKVDIKVD